MTHVDPLSLRDFTHLGQTVASSVIKRWDFRLVRGWPTTCIKKSEDSR